MKQLKHAILELFFAGTETTSSTIYWALLCLLHYPEAQKRIRKEVMNAFGEIYSNLKAFTLGNLLFALLLIQLRITYRTRLPRGVVGVALDSP